MVKVLFVCSSNSINGITPVVLNQGKSLINLGIYLSYFTINEKGLTGYLKAVHQLRQFLKYNNFDIIHAHYSLSGFVASLAGAKGLVVSLMGSDLKLGILYKFAIKLFNFFFWSTVIVKSKDMYNSLNISSAIIIPNGVDLNKFKETSKGVALKELGWDASKTHILFGANPNRPEKNFKLAKEAFDYLKRSDLKLHYLDNIPNNDMPNYYNAADVVLITSLWEGSPNVIKEAMACNRPIVSTNVGDIKWLLNDLDGCFISRKNSQELCQKISESLSYSKRSKITKGRERLKNLSLNIESVAKRINGIYILLLKHKRESG